MHRFLYLARPRHDLTLAEFHQRWRDHSRLAATCPDVLAEVRGYRQWQVVAPAADGIVGVGETRCADAAAVYRMLQCAGTRSVLQPDELRFLETPCREAGLVADDRKLCAVGSSNALEAVDASAAASVALDHACLWLVPRPSTVLEERIVLLRAAFAAAAGATVAAHAAPGVSGALEGLHELSLGHCDFADDVSPFAALLFARFASAAPAARVAAAWRTALLPGENVWLLQRAARHLEKTESVS